MCIKCIFTSLLMWSTSEQKYSRLSILLLQVSSNYFEPTFTIFFWLEEYGQTSPNKNQSPNLWRATSILVCCIFGRKELLAKLSKFIKSQLIFTQTGPRLGPPLGWVKVVVICEFWSTLQSSSLSFSLRKIMWLNSQQPKIRQHVKHHRIFVILSIYFRLKNCFLQLYQFYKPF